MININDVEKSIILLVDDNPRNLDVLINFLKESSSEIRIAGSGEEALELATRITPDVIILDVMMPGINGFETCRRLKKIDKLKNVPVIFMTALSDPADKVMGFKSGGSDYVTKPLHHEEVLARINAHLTIRNQQKILERQNNEKNEFIDVVLHQLRNYLTKINLPAHLIKKAKSADEVNELSDMVIQDVKLMLEVITNFLDINKLETGDVNFSFAKTPLSPLAKQSVTNHISSAESKQITINFEAADDEFNIYADKIVILQILDNLISNAVKFSPNGKDINVRVFKTKNSVCCEIEDEGQGLTSEDMDKIFGKYARLSAKPTGDETSTGLGLSIVKKLVDAMNGKINANSAGKDKGAVFTLEFPPYTPAKEKEN